MLDTVVEGNRFTLPKDAHPPKQYTFRGWWLNGKLYQPGDTVTLTDYVTTFKAVYDDGKEEMPEITTQPRDYTGIIGATVEFTVEATGENLTYQWQFKDGANWKDSGMEGTKTPQLRVPITEARIGQQYRCIVTSGNGTNATSNAAKLTVTK